MSATVTLPPLNTPRKWPQGWVITIPDEVARVIGVAEGSQGLLHPRRGSLEIEILPPLSPAQMAEFDEIFEESKEVLMELQRRGD